MKKYPLILALLIPSAFFVITGQKMKSTDLIGLWGFDQANISLMFEFIDSSRFAIEPDNLPNKLNPKKYTLANKNEENVLTLYFDNGGNSWDSTTYLVRKSDADFLMLQLADSNKSGEPLFKWKRTDKQNTLYLYRMERKKSTIP